MIAIALEVTALLVLAVTGWLLVPRGSGAPWRVAVALPVGVAAHACVALVLLATRLPVAHPWVAAIGALVIGLAVALLRGRGEAGTLHGLTGSDGARRRRTRLGPVSRTAVAVGLAVLVAAVLVTAIIPLANVTSDSFRYVTVGQLLAEDADAGRMSAFLLQSRGLVVGAVHGLALPDLGYLRALGPLVAASMLGALWLLVRDGLRDLDPVTGRWVAAAAVTLVATNHRVLYNAFYINGHALFAVWLLLLAGWVWRLQRQGEDSAVSPLLVGILATALVLVRPEGALVAATALVPLAVATKVPLARCRRALIGFGLGLVAWHGIVLMPLALRDGYPPPTSMTGLAVLGVVVLVAAALLGTVQRMVGRRPLLVAHALVWVTVAVFSARSPSVLLTAAGATVRNVLAEGAWGSSLLVLAALLGVALLLRRVVAEGALLFPLFTFVPLSILLAFLRGGPGYRVGPGDSLNRMLLHILPLAVLALALTAAGEPRRLTSRVGRRGSRSDSAGDRDEHSRAVAGGDQLGA